MELYRLLLKFEVNRKILSKFGRKEFTLEEIKIMEDEFDSILSRAVEENNGILSSYWKEKTNTLLNRCIKYKKSIKLIFISLWLSSNNIYSYFDTC